MAEKTARIISRDGTAALSQRAEAWWFESANKFFIVCRCTFAAR
jgi:hypothetical protein